LPPGLQGHRPGRGKTPTEDDAAFSEGQLSGLTFLGLVGIIDPLRPEAKAAVTACRAAGIEVAMVTGDHPITAATIARELNLLDSPDQVVTGPQLKALETEAEVDALVSRGRVFARVEPQQKLEIVQSLQRCGFFVAVSGDGANDAPALRAAQVGVAMGKSGTDVARETADIILTDDNFASIVGGVEEGRIAYANVRKVIFLLISTGRPNWCCSRWPSCRTSAPAAGRAALVAQPRDQRHPGRCPRLRAGRGGRVAQKTAANRASRSSTA
jgi:Ca2+-transporting ATPase